MKKKLKKTNPTLPPYLPRFKEVLWVLGDFEYGQSIAQGYFDSLAKFIIATYPSRKQVDALMEMLYFVMVWKFFLDKDSYDSKFEKLISSNQRIFQNEKEEFLKRYNKFIMRAKKFADEYIERCKISSDELPFELGDSNKNYSSPQFSFLVKHSLKHSIDVATTYQAPEIIDFNWSNLSISKILEELNIRETAARNKRKKQKKNLPEGQIWLKFEDGWKWVYLPTYQNSMLAQEGDHCATVEGWMGRNFGRLLYLADNENNLRLTASYAHLDDSRHRTEDIANLWEGHDFGIIGQIRGTANSKPKKELRHYITGLLCDERVIFHIPDSYRSDDQFLITDLDELQLGMIQSRNPSVLSLVDGLKYVPSRVYKVMFHLITDEVIDLKFKGKLNLDKPNPKAEVIFWSDSTEEFLKALSQKRALEIWEMIEAGEPLYNYDGYKTDVESFVEGLHEDRLKILFDKLVERGFKPDSEDSGDVLKKVFEDKETLGAIYNAVETGYSTGSDAEAYKQLKARIEELTQILYTNLGMQSDITDSLYSENAITLTWSMVKMLEKIQKTLLERSAEDINLVALTEDFSDEFHEPRNVFDDYFSYDSESAEDDFFGHRIYDL